MRKSYSVTADIDAAIQKHAMVTTAARAQANAVP
jgi:hypothetical protein